MVSTDYIGSTDSMDSLVYGVGSPWDHTDDWSGISSMQHVVAFLLRLCNFKDASVIVFFVVF